MSHPPLRLVHASDLHLEAPPAGLEEVPKHLREQLLDCPYAAALSVFETALSQQADALLLAGDVVDLSRSGVRAIAFLRLQMERLAEAGISVFWVGGKADPPEAWPRCSPLPPTVHLFQRGAPQRHDVLRDGAPIAHVVGASATDGRDVRADQFQPHADGLPTVGIAYGPLRPQAAQRQQVRYLALGGRHQTKSCAAGDRLAHYPGTPQGRSLAESGPHGCTLIHIAAKGPVKTQRVATDAVRWHREQVEISAGMTRETLRSMMWQRIEARLSQAKGADVLIGWELHGFGTLVHQLRTTPLREQLLAELRREFGHRSPSAWPLGLQVHTARPLPQAWYEQESILGDVLQAVREIEAEGEEALQLSTYLGADNKAEALVALAKIASGKQHGELLGQVTDLCVDLLTTQEQHEVRVAPEDAWPTT